MANVATNLILEDDTSKVWEMILPAGGSSGIHTHHLPWHFVVTKSAEIQIVDINNNVIVPPSILPVGVQMTFVPDGDIAICQEDKSIVIPSTHQAVNLSNHEYREILVELKLYGK